MSNASFSFLPLGAIIQSIKVKDLNIVLGFDTQEQYAKYNTPYFGETIGRVANRIKNAQIDCLNGRTYPLAANNGPNTLHGGYEGWGKHIWDGPKPEGTKTVPGISGFKGGESVSFKLTSKDGDEGFPGEIKAKVTYTSGTQDIDGKEAIILAIEYEAKMIDGADETIINTTNHSYFNLSGDPTIDGTVVRLGTQYHLPFDTTSIPTGDAEQYLDLPVTEPFVLSTAAPNFDNCFVMAADPAAVCIDTRSESLALNLDARHPKSGIRLEVLSTEPSFQFYTGQGTNVPAVEGNPARHPRSGFCCEPGRFVNACNVPGWKAMTVLKRGEVYGARIVYRIRDESV